MELLYIATFFVALLSSLLSGMASGGGGFIISPYWLITGMSPAQSATSGAFMGLGMSVSSLAAYKNTGHLPANKKLIIISLVMTLLCSLIGPFFLQETPISVYKPLLAVFTLASLPVLFIKKPTAMSGKNGKLLGYALLFLMLLASSFITVSAFSILITLTLLYFFNLSVLSSTALRRAMGIIQSVVILVILVALGNLVWQHALAGALGGMIGSFVGTRFSLKHGDKFAKYTLAASGIIGSLLLLV